MYVIEKKLKWYKPRCEWIKSERDDIMSRLEVYDQQGYAGVTTGYRCDELEPPDDENNEYQVAEYEAVKEYLESGNSLPATVVCYPGRVASETYRVLTPEEERDIKVWEELLEEWAAFSDEYEYLPNYFDDDQAESEWIKETDADAAEAIAKAADLYPYVVRERATGDVIEEFQTYPDAKGTIIDLEDRDHVNGVYTPNRYEIYNPITKRIVK